MSFSSEAVIVIQIRKSWCLVRHVTTSTLARVRGNGGLVSGIGEKLNVLEKIHPFYGIALCSLECYGKPCSISWIFEN